MKSRVSKVNEAIMTLIKVVESIAQTDLKAAFSFQVENDLYGEFKLS